jgi:hypothetical protein
MQHALYRQLLVVALFLERQWVHLTMLVSYQEGMGPH